MGIFHYKAELIEQNDKEVLYNFFPDYFGHENIFGEFRILLENWQIQIIKEVMIEDKNSSGCNERPVNALTYKIKKYFKENGEFPKKVFHIA